jgi:hypothetical protein
MDSLLLETQQWINLNEEQEIHLKLLNGAC